MLGSGFNTNCGVISPRPFDIQQLLASGSAESSYAFRNGSRRVLPVSLIYFCRECVGVGVSGVAEARSRPEELDFGLSVRMAGIVGGSGGVSKKNPGLRQINFARCGRKSVGP